MGAITKRLVLAHTAGTPPVIFPRLNFYGIGGFAGDIRFGHGALPEKSERIIGRIHQAIIRFRK